MWLDSATFMPSLSKSAPTDIHFPSPRAQEQVLPLEHKVEQILSEIGCLRSTQSEQSRKLEETESLVKQVAGQHEVQENLAQQTSEFLKDHFGKKKTDAEIPTDSGVQRRWEADSSFPSVNFNDFYLAKIHVLCYNTIRCVFLFHQHNTPLLIHLGKSAGAKIQNICPQNSACQF